MNEVKTIIVEATPQFSVEDVVQAVNSFVAVFNPLSKDLFTHSIKTARDGSQAVLIQIGLDANITCGEQQSCTSAPALIGFIAAQQLAAGSAVTPALTNRTKRVA